MAKAAPRAVCSVEAAIVVMVVDAEGEKGEGMAKETVVAIVVTEMLEEAKAEDVTVVEVLVVGAAMEVDTTVDLEMICEHFVVIQQRLPVPTQR